MSTAFGQDLIASMEEALAFSRGKETGARVYHIKVPIVDVAQIHAAGPSQSALRAA